jgi:hypothetical protein
LSLITIPIRFMHPPENGISSCAAATKRTHKTSDSFVLKRVEQQYGDMQVLKLPLTGQKKAD